MSRRMTGLSLLLAAVVLVAAFLAGAPSDAIGVAKPVSWRGVETTHDPEGESPTLFGTVPPSAGDAPALRSELAPDGIAIAGTVRGARDRKPLAGARYCLRADDAGAVLFTAAGSADADGGFRVQIPPTLAKHGVWRLTCVAAGHLVQELHVMPEQADLQVVLEEGGRVAGRVVDEHDVGVPGADVIAYLPGGFTGWPHVGEPAWLEAAPRGGRGVSAADGTFSVAGLASEGPHTIYAHKVGYTSTPAPFGWTLATAPPGAESVVVRLHRLRAMGLRFVDDETGAPLPLGSCTYRIQGSGAWTLTTAYDADIAQGRTPMRNDPLADTLRLHFVRGAVHEGLGAEEPAMGQVLAPGYEPTQFSLTPGESPDPDSQRVLLKPLPGTKLRDLQVHAKFADLEFTGQLALLIDFRDDSIGRACVPLRIEDGVGRVRIRMHGVLSAGQVEVQGSGRGFAHWSPAGRVTRIDLSQEGDMEIHVQLSGGAVSLDVRTVQGDPLSDVEAAFAKGESEFQFEDSVSLCEQVILPTAMRRIWLAPGSWRLAVRTPEGRSAASTVMVGAEGGTSVVKLEVR